MRIRILIARISQDHDYVRAGSGNASVVPDDSALLFALEQVCSARPLLHRHSGRHLETHFPLRQAQARAANPVRTKWRKLTCPLPSRQSLIAGTMHARMINVVSKDLSRSMHQRQQIDANSRKKSHELLHPRATYAITPHSGNWNENMNPPLPERTSFRATLG